MKAICPISGIPFRTYDSLPIRVQYPHPIFSLSFQQLIEVLDTVREDEQNILETLIKKQQNNNKIPDDMAFIANMEQDKGHLAQKYLNVDLIESIQEKNYQNPSFKLYQSKSLIFLAFMKQLKLLENEDGIYAQPSPHLMNAYFWNAIELFVWIESIRNPHSLELIPKYRVSTINKTMGNINEYLTILRDIQYSFGQKYFSRSEEYKLDNMQRVLAILAKRRNANNESLTKGNNKIAATWAIMVTRPSEDVKAYWHAILTSPSGKLLFEGVEIEGKWYTVTIQDCRELRDYLLDNLLQPRGNEKSEKQSHEDDKEYYFIARHMVLEIINQHISTFEQGTAGYELFEPIKIEQNRILSTTDVELNNLAQKAQIPTMPTTFLNMVDKIQQMAKWRLSTKQYFMNEINKTYKENTVDVQTTEKGKINYEIL